MMSYPTYVLLALLTALPTLAAPPQAYRIPAYFEPNQGQVDSQVKFIARGFRGQIWITGNEIVTALTQRPPRDPQAGKRTPPDEQPAKREVVRMKLLDANLKSVARGEKKFASYSNYFIGNDPKKWRSDIPNYAEAWLRDVWPSIDMRFYANEQREFEYDFIVKPGADPSRIRFEFDGAPAVLTRNGDIDLSTPLGTITQQKPLVRQAGHAIAAAYSQYGRVFSVALNAYDPAEALVVDPVLAYSTYLGGNGDEFFGAAIAMDTTGSAYVTGTTKSTNFPILGAFQSTLAPTSLSLPYDIFVTKLNPTGNALSYSTYLGGFGDDYDPAIAIDATGAAYVTGQTGSSNFPTQNAFQPNHGGSSDIFVTKLSPAGNALAYSTYLGGTKTESRAAIAVNASGAAYVAGVTISSNFPTVNAFQTTKAANADIFVTKLNPAGSTLAYSTYLGGNGDEDSPAIAIDSNGAAYVVGVTSSTNFPTVNPFQSTKAGNYDLFVTKLNPAGNTLAYSTYLGSITNDHAPAVALDSNGAAYITGWTISSTFPTLGAFQPLNGGGYDAFVTKLNPAGNTLSYSTYLGGSSNESSTAIAVDAAGSAYVAGTTYSHNFPTLGASQPNNLGNGDVFVTKLNPAGNTLSFSTYLGGSGGEQMVAIAVDAAGATYVTGYTDSFNFPTQGPFQSNKAGSIDMFITKFAPGSGTTLTSSPNPSTLGQNVILTANVNPSSATGFVTFYDGTTSLGMASLMNGVATLNTTALAAGVRMLRAVYAGDGGNPASTSTNVSHTVNSVSSSTFVSPSGSPYTVGTDPRAVVVADFNSDGQQDFATVNHGSENVTVMLGAGNGTFAPMAGSPFPTGPGPQAITAGDFNGDGRIDLATANDGFSGNTANLGMVSFLINTGSGFTSNTTTAFGVLNGVTIAAADFDGDGKVDLAIGQLDTNAVSFLKGNGNRTFAKGFGNELPACTIEVTATTIGDLNNDGKPDVVTLCGNEQKLFVMLGTGAGFTSSTVNLSSQMLSMALGRFTADAFVDVALGGAQVLVLPGTGSGGFGTAILSAAMNPRGLVAGEFTGDGFPDLASVNNNLLGGLTILPGNGLGSFTTGVTAAAGTQPFTLASGQFDGDARTDFVVLSAGNKATILLGAGTVNTTTSLAAPASSALGGQVALVASVLPVTATGTVTFYDGVNVLGAATLSSGSAALQTTSLGGGTHTLRAYYNGTPIYLPSSSANVSHKVFTVASAFYQLTSSYATGDLAFSVAVADFNGDGKPDYALTQASGVGVYFGNGNGTFSVAPGSPFPTGSGPLSVIAVDVNGDGKPDLVTANSSPFTATILLNNGSGSFVAAPGSGFVIDPSNQPPRSVAAADFNRDGKVDLAFSIFGTNAVQVYLGNGAGGFALAAGSPFAVGLNPANVVTADFNQDGNPDLATANKTSGSVSILLGNGAGGFAPATTVSVGPGIYTLALGDVDNDGRPDLVVAMIGTNQVAVLRSTAPGVFGAPTFFAVGTQPYSMALADFNGDGKVDIATTNLGSANVSFLLNNGAGGFAPASFSPQSAGALQPVAAATGDFNADGRVDLVVGTSTGVSVIMGQAPSPTAKLIAVSSLSRDAGTNEVIVTFTVSNAAAATATNVQVLTAKIGITNPTAATTLPIPLGNLASLASSQATVRFPGSVGTAGSTVSITLGVTSTQSPLNSISLVKLP